jgi:LmbE family N-acetylglucosaminyl deacetylase
MPKDTLKNEFTDVAHSVGLREKNYRIFDYRVRYLSESRQEILEELVRVKKDFSPDIVIGPSQNDRHQDHQVVANEMVRAVKDCSSIICYELPWNHVRFDTQLFVRLERKHIDKKIELLSKYHSQVSLNKPYFSEEFITGWAKMRGVQVKSEFSEAFEVVRWMI